MDGHSEDTTDIEDTDAWRTLARVMGFDIQSDDDIEDTDGWRKLAGIMGFGMESSSENKVDEEVDGSIPTPQIQNNNRSENQQAEDGSSDDEDNSLAEVLRRLESVKLIKYTIGTRPCAFPSCYTPTSTRYCLFHLQATTCSEEGCNRRNFKKSKCRFHSGYVPPRCEVAECQNQAKVKGRCYTHGAPVKMCKFSGCNKRVKFNGFCHGHNPVHGLCLQCRSVAVKRKGFKCSTCSAPREFSAEKRIVRMIYDLYPSVEMKTNKQFPGTRHRPDLLLKAPGGVIILEIDEHQHRDREGETQRLLNLWKASLTPMYIVRYNPDEVHDTEGKPIRIREDERIQILRETLDQLLGNSTTTLFPTNKPGLKFLFYDKGREETLRAEFNRILSSQ